MSENEINKALEDKLYDKYLEIWKEVKSNLNKTMDKKQIKSDKLQKLIKSEIEKLSKMNDLKGFKLLIVNNKPIGVYKNEKEIYFTTIALGYILSKNKEFIGKISKCRIEKYKKENRVFVRIYDEKDNKKTSDKRLFIFNFSNIEKMKKEANKIVELTIKEKSTRPIKKKVKELKSIEL